MFKIQIYIPKIPGVVDCGPHWADWHYAEGRGGPMQFSSVKEAEDHAAYMKFSKHRVVDLGAGEGGL